MPETVEVTFQAQEWKNDYAYKADREPNRVKFEVPYEDAVDADGDLLADDTHESDSLAHHPKAPEWVTEWAEENPFYILTEIVK